MSLIPVDRIRDIVGRLPTTRDEDWKYTDLSRAREISTRWLEAGAALPSASGHEDVDTVTDSIDATWFVFDNGVLSELPDTGEYTAEKIGEVSAGDGALAELNAALLADGLRVRVKGTVSKPIGLLFIDGGEEPSITQGYVEIDFAANSACEVVEYHVSRGSVDHYANTMVSLSVGDAASVRHVRIQDRSPSHLQTGRTVVNVAQDARYTSASFDLGGGLIRNDLNIEIGMPGAEVSFDGLYLAGDGQHIDNHTRIDHRVGPATSRQEYRGILNGKCRCVWNGKAIVHEGADGTDADQANHNLLLSEKAEIDAKPELEIYTDDVKCSHGTTVGQLDNTAMFYLRSRGLDKRRATQILTHAFAAGLVSRVPVDAAKQSISDLMEARLGELIQSDEDFSG
jgi:Fe-S cluster assembly protein SufD